MKLINSILLLGLIALVLFIKVLISVAILSMLIVPITYLYAKLVGKSYSSVIDMSNILYKLNKFGQWSIVIVVSFILFYYVFKF